MKNTLKVCFVILTPTGLCRSQRSKASGRLQETYSLPGAASHTVLPVVPVAVLVAVPVVEHFELWSLVREVTGVMQRIGEVVSL